MPAASTVLIVGPPDTPPLPFPGEPASLPACRLSSTSAEAAAQIRRQRPALLVIDARAQASQACTLAAEVLADPVSSGLPAVFVTAAGDRDTAAEAWRLGAIDVWSAPFEPAALLGKLRAFAALHRDRTELQLALDLNRRLAAEATAPGRAAPEFPLPAVLDQLLPHVAVLDPRGTVLAANRTLRAAAEVSAGDVVGRPFWECSWWSYSTGVADTIRESCHRAATGETVRFDVQLHRARGEEIWVDYQAAPLRDPGGRVDRLVVCGIEISERKHAQAEASRQTGLVEAVLQACPAGIIVAEPDGRIVRMNPANDRLWGHPPMTDALAGYGEWKAWWADNSARAGARIAPAEGSLARALRGETVTGDLVEIEPFDAPGERRYTINSAAPIRGARGEVRGGVVVQMDVTELKTAELTLEKIVAERTEKLRETVHDLEAFSSSVAHDMRAPLRTMTGYCDILLDDWAAQLDPEARHYVERIGAAAARLDQLITDILDYSHVARRDLPLETIDLEALLHDLVDGYANLRDAREFIRWESLPAVHANRSALTQVFSNLLSNAVKFVPKGRSPRIRIRSEPVEPAAEGALPTVRIWVEDNGIGMDPAHQGKLFQMFQRLSPGKEYEGTGMGLAIARKAVERMGGQIGVVSDLGQGSRFWLTLRRA